MVPDIVEGAGGQVLGDRNYWAPLVQEALAPAGIELLAPYRHRTEDPDPVGSRSLSRLRWRIETVAAQLVERYHLKRLWARDAWHLTSRLLRKALSHTIAVWLCLAHGLAPCTSATSWRTCDNLHIASVGNHRVGPQRDDAAPAPGVLIS